MKRDVRVLEDDAAATLVAALVRTGDAYQAATDAGLTPQQAEAVLAHKDVERLVRERIANRLTTVTLAQAVHAMEEALRTGDAKTRARTGAAILAASGLRMEAAAKASAPNGGRALEDMSVGELEAYTARLRAEQRAVVVSSEDVKKDFYLPSIVQGEASNTGAGQDDAKSMFE